MYYVTSDIHGSLDRFNHLLDILSLNENDTLFVLGDMIDRGKDSIPVLQTMMSSKQIIPFIGNHEHLMLCALKELEEIIRTQQKVTSWKHEYYARNWLHPGNGGKATYTQLQTLDECERNRILAYVKSAYVQKQVAVGDRHFLLCHGSGFGLPTKGDIRYCTGDVEALYPADLPDMLLQEEMLDSESSSGKKLYGAIWHAPYRIWSDEKVPLEVFARYPYTFILGHTPVQGVLEDVQDQHGHVPEIYHEGNVYVIDGGCALRSRLGYTDADTALLCLCLDTMETFTVQ